MATLDEIGQEKQKLSERLARIDAERAKLADQLNELEVAERVLSRFGKPVTTEKRRRGRPARTEPAPAAQRSRSRTAPAAHTVSLSDATLQAVQAHGEGATAGEVLGYLSRELGMTVRPPAGVAIQKAAPPRIATLLSCPVRPNRRRSMGAPYEAQDTPALQVRAGMTDN